MKVNIDPPITVLYHMLCMMDVGTSPLITENAMEATSIASQKKDYCCIVHSRKFIFMWFSHCSCLLWTHSKSVSLCVPCGWCEPPCVESVSSMPLWGDKLVMAHQSDSSEAGGGREVSRYHRFNEKPILSASLGTTTWLFVSTAEMFCNCVKGTSRQKSIFCSSSPLY